MVTVSDKCTGLPSTSMESTTEFSVDFGTVVIVTCKTGHTMTGSDTMTCKEGTTFTASATVNDVEDDESGNGNSADSNKRAAERRFKRADKTETSCDIGKCDC